MYFLFHFPVILFIILVEWVWSVNVVDFIWFIFQLMLNKFDVCYSGN